MPTVQRSASVPYSAKQMFDLVNDIEKYPEFLHWCTGARIDSRQGSTIEATLDIAVLGFQRSFRTRNTLRSPEPNRDRARVGTFSQTARRMAVQRSARRRRRHLAVAGVRGHVVAVRRGVLEGVRAARGCPDGRFHAARSGLVWRAADVRVAASPARAGLRASEGSRYGRRSVRTVSARRCGRSLRRAHSRNRR